MTLTGIYKVGATNELWKKPFSLKTNEVSIDAEWAPIQSLEVENWNWQLIIYDWEGICKYRMIIDVHSSQEFIIQVPQFTSKQIARCPTLE